MDAATLIDNRVLVRVIGRTRTQQFCHERRFAAEAHSRNHDRPSFEADYSGMHENPARRVLSDRQLQM